MFWLKCVAVCIFLGAARAALTKVNLYDNNEYANVIMITAELANDKCTTLPKRAANKALQISNNRCIMLYSHPNCQGRSYEVPAPLYPFQRSNLEYFEKEVDSLRICKKHEIGRSNNWEDNDKNQEDLDAFSTKKIELFGNADYRGLLLDTNISPSCTTLPTRIFNEVTSVRSEVCVMLYSLPHCKGFSFEVSQLNTSYLTHFNDLTQSFRPCTKESVLGEPNLSFEVVKFNYFNVEGSENKHKPTIIKKITVLTNNGTATIKKAFEVTIEDKQKTVMTWGEMASVAHDVSVSATVQVETEAKIPLLGRSKVTASLTAGYEYNKAKETSKGVEKQIEEKKTIKLSDEIPVPACTKYKVTSYAKVMKGYPVKFVTEMEVKGKQGERQMWANEVKSKLSNKLTYIRNKDEYTVLAQGNGMIITDFKVGTKTVAHGRKIPIANCERY